MMAKELQDWFPEAQISDQPVEKEGYLTLPLASQQWILLEEARLSEREKQLVALLTQQEQLVRSILGILIWLRGRDRHHKLLKRFSWFIVIFPIFSRKI